MAFGAKNMHSTFPGCNLLVYILGVYLGHEFQPSKNQRKFLWIFVVKNSEVWHTSFYPRRRGGIFSVGLVRGNGWVVWRQFFDF